MQKFFIFHCHGSGHTEINDIWNGADTKALERFAGSVLNLMVRETNGSGNGSCRHEPRRWKSAEWCSRAVDQCWKMKQSNIRSGERAEAEEAYKKAKSIYEKIFKESSE